MQHSLNVGDWQVEPRRNRLSRGTRVEQLEPQMMEVLLCLAERPGEVLSREEIPTQAWEGRSVSDENLSVAIHGLRKAMGDQARAPRYIETIPRVGYRLITEVSTPVSTPPSQTEPEGALANSGRAAADDAEGRNPKTSGPSWRTDRGVVSVGLSLLALGALVAFGVLQKFKGRDGSAFPASAPESVLDSSRPARPLSEEARREFELGYFHIMRLTPQDVKKAREHFGRCLELDPGFASAWAGLSAALLRSAPEDIGVPPGDRLDRAREAAERSVELRPTLAAAQVAMARIHFYLDWHPKAAEDCLRRALELDPRDFHGYQLNAVVQLALGRPDSAETAARRAVELDPAAPARYVDLAGLLMLTGNFEASVLELKAALELDPRLAEARLLIPFVHLLAGRHDTFVDEFRATWDEQELDEATRAALEAGYAADGVPGLLRVLLDRQGATMPATERARLRMVLGESETALADLRSCVPLRCPSLLWLDTDSTWDPLREDPGFQDLARRIREIRKS